MTKICKILLVEDQRELQDLLRELFADEGYRFLIVGDGKAMRAALDRDPDIDVVVLDLLLPGGIDGLTLARDAADRGLPAIIVTGDHRHAETLEAGGHRYLLKPFRIASFLDLIETVLRETEARCEREAKPANGSDEKPARPSAPGARRRTSQAVSIATRSDSLN